MDSFLTQNFEAIKSCFEILKMETLENICIYNQNNILLDSFVTQNFKGEFLLLSF